MARSWGFSSDGVFKIRRIVGWPLLFSAAVPCLYLLAYEVPAYMRRSDLQSRVFRGRISFLPGPYAYSRDYFHTRSRIPKSLSRFVSEEWTLPLESIVTASLVAQSDNDVQKLAPERELERLVVIAKDGNCTDQLLRHLIALPKLQSLSLCNVPLTDRGVDLLLRMPQLKELHIECSTEPSPGLMRLSELVHVESFRLMDARHPVTDDVYLQIAKMSNLQDLGLIGTTITADRCRAIAGSESIKQIFFAYMDCNLTLEHARILAKTRNLRCVVFSESYEAKMEPDAQAYLEQRSLIPDEDLLRTLPRL